MCTFVSNLKVIYIVLIGFILVSCISDSGSAVSYNHDINGKWKYCYKDDEGYQQVTFYFWEYRFYFKVDNFQDNNCEVIIEEYFLEGGEFSIGQELEASKGEPVKRLTLFWYVNTVDFGPDLVFFIQANRLVFGDYVEGEIPEMNYEAMYLKDK